MAISIIVEDGSNVPDANSFVSVADARTYAANRGVVLSSDDDEVAAQLTQAMDYIEAQECLFLGSRASSDQSLTWPRVCVKLNGSAFPSDRIPKSLVGAQVQLAMAVASGVDLQPTIQPGDFVTEETVGPITTKYADPSKLSMVPTVGAAAALLAPLFGQCAARPYALTTVRV